MRHVKILFITEEPKLEPTIENAMAKLQEQGYCIIDVTIIHEPEVTATSRKFDTNELTYTTGYDITPKQYTVKIFYEDNPVEERFKATSSSVQQQEAALRELKEIEALEMQQLKNQEEAIIAERY